MGDLADDLRRFLSERLEAASLDDPFLPSLLRWQARLDGLTASPASPASPLALGLLQRWAERGVGDANGPRRYPWEIPVAAFPPVEAIERWRPWDDESKVDDLERWARRFWLPAVLGDTLELLEGQAAGQIQPAAALIRRVRRRVDADLAVYVAEHEPWPGTFALGDFAGRPRSLERFYPILTALLMRYVTDAKDDGGLVLGRRFPLFGIPLVGPTAQLGRGIIAIGQGLELLGGIVAFLRAEQRADGGWGEHGQPTDLLTTLAAASFLARIDPDFDPRSPFGALAASPEAARGWSAMDPRDGSFVAAELAAYVDAATLPFEARFRFPHVPGWLLDPHAGLPRFGAFQDLARLVASVPGLARTRFEVAFLDLADFGRWNTDHGMELGDAALRFFGEFLREIPGARVIQDGGDEILVVGAPGRRGLLRDLVAHFEGHDGHASWRERFRSRFGERWVVLPRGIVARAEGAGLIEARRRSGEEIGRVKCWYRTPGPNGTILGGDEAASLPDCRKDEGR